MFYPLAASPAERREHAIVQMHWPKGHHTRVHRPCNTCSIASGMPEEQAAEAIRRLRMARFPPHV